MDIKKIYQEKLVTVDEALDHIRSGHIIVGGTYASEPVLQWRQLHTIAPRVRDVEVWTGIDKEDYPFITDETYRDSFRINSIFYGPQSRQIHPTHRVSYYPLHMSQMAAGVIAHGKPDVYMAAVAPMDENGYFTLSPSLQIEGEIFHACDIRILEVNPNVPRLCSAEKVHISEVTCLIESDQAVFAVDMYEPSADERKAAAYVASLIQDGDTLQFGIGNTSNAMTDALRDKKDLGLHTELLSTAGAKLMQMGVVNNSRKTLHPGKTVCAFAWGDRDFYRYITDNPDIELMRSSYVNHPAVIAQNDNLVSVNTALQIDLTGQICSESIGTRQYSGTGGATDFASGAYMSRGGRGVIVVSSTTKNGTISKIQPVLSPGSAVSISRNWVDYVVTEYGIAHLRGASIGERAERLIAIAHPDFRAELRRQADELKIW